jgi:hypothetical protein
MPEQDHDYVDFMGYDNETDTQVKLCRVYLTKGELSYEGPEAKQIKERVESHPHLEAERKIGGYTLLAALPHVFGGGSYNYCTKVKEPYTEDE